MDRPKPSSYTAQQTMKANRRRDTRAELAVRRLLHRAGARYRVDYAPDPADRRRKADIVFTRARIAVFIDGCFWHGCPQHYIPPKSNADYWLPKIEGNRKRDADPSAHLKAVRWRVLRFWEHEDPVAIVEQILQELIAARKGGSAAARQAEETGPEGIDR